jgi:hypothetical protein
MYEAEANLTILPIAYNKGNLIEGDNIYPPNHIIESYGLPDSMKLLYSRVDDKKEFIWKDWTFFSKEKIELMEKNNKQKHYIQLASVYMGMGWIAVLCWDKVLNKFFIHTDGGENGYTQNDHYEYFHLNVDTKKGFCLMNDSSKTFDIDELNKIDNSNIIHKCYRMT